MLNSGQLLHGHALHCTMLANIIFNDPSQLEILRAKNQKPIFNVVPAGCQT